MQTLEYKTITLQIPLDIFSSLKQTPDEFARNLRIAAAAKWYEKGLVSQGKAAEIAGLCREDFIAALGKFEVSPFQYSSQEVLREAGYDTDLGR